MSTERAWTEPSRAHTRRALASFVLGTALALSVASSAVAGPAIDEYSLDLPDAKGKVESPEKAPTAHPSSLPPTIAAALAHDPHGKALATIATAGELGAPAAPGQGGLLNAAVEGDQPSALAAMVAALDDPAVIGVLLALLAGGAVLVIRRRRVAD
jgi:hypothetical protein